MITLPENITLPRRRPAAEVRLDANESPFNTPNNLYPDAEMTALREAWGQHERIPARCICFTRGTEEAIDLALRLYALPTRDSVAAPAPTRSVYRRRAQLNRLEYREARLRADDYALDVEALLDVVSVTTKVIILCSPNSPTGGTCSLSQVEDVLSLFDGMVIVDESYVDFAPETTCLSLLNRYDNLIILRSFSHAWGMAGLNLAAVVARPEVIDDFRRIGYAYPVDTLAQGALRQMVARRLDVDKWARQIVNERLKVEIALRQLPECIKVYPSQANFLLVRFTEPQALYKYLLANGIAVCPVDGCLRITIGLPWQNSALLGALRRRMD